MSEDWINHPQHYASSKIECIDAMKEMQDQPNPKVKLSNSDFYLWGAIFKYIWRFPFKEKPVEDLKKAKFYIDRLIKSLESQP